MKYRNESVRPLLYELYRWQIMHKLGHVVANENIHYVRPCSLRVWAAFKMPTAREKSFLRKKEKRIQNEIQQLTCFQNE